MAVRRTLKDKQSAKEARLKAVANETDSGVSYSLSSRTESIKAKSGSDTLLKIDQSHIAKDLVKTLLISGLLFSLLIGIYFYLGYN